MATSQTTDSTASISKEVLSINQRRWRKFKTFKRGYYSMILLLGCYLISLFLPVLVNDKALMVRYEGKTYFPAIRDFLDIPGIGKLAGSSFISGDELGQTGNKGECLYRLLAEQYDEENAVKPSSNTVVMPLYPYSAIEDLSAPGNAPFMPPLTATEEGTKARIFGTDDRGRDVFVRMVYGFRISITFALLVAIIEYLIAIPIGAMMGYYGGWFDTIMQRFIEIWSSLPFLFLIIIVVSITQPSFIILVGMLAIFSWMGITYQMRSQFYREKTRDYVVAAISIGVPTSSILLKHILPNSLVPIITYFPFAIVGGIGALVSLDFLGFGLAPPTPSWGEMVSIGLDNITSGYYWLVLIPFAALFFTLTLTVFIGEGVREAFDPKTFSRLR